MISTCDRGRACLSSCVSPPNPETCIRCGRCDASQVKTLKPLSTLKLQQLCAILEEENFVNEQYIATEGDMGEKFYLTVMGTVRSICLCKILSVQIISSSLSSGMEVATPLVVYCTEYCRRVWNILGRVRNNDTTPQPTTALTCPDSFNMHCNEEHRKHNCSAIPLSTSFSGSKPRQCSYMC